MSTHPRSEGMTSFLFSPWHMPTRPWSHLAGVHCTIPPWCHHAPFTIVCHHHFHSPLDHPTSPQLEVEGLAPGVRGEKVEVKGAKLG